MAQINLKKLAEELNLSVSTISRALSDSHEISKSTKLKVLSLAEKLHYQPNPYARSLRKRNSNTVAIIIPEIENNFFALAINGIEEIAQQNGFHVLIYITHENISKEIGFVTHLLNGRVDGVIMSLSGETDNISHINELLKNDVPIVFFDRISEQAKTVKVTTNDYESGLLATKHLIDKGCKRICYLGYTNSQSIGIHRLNGYLDALKQNNISVNDDYVLNCSSEHDFSFVKIKQLLESDNKPDGIFASVEQLALISYEVCSFLSLKIPEDIKVIGFSNSKMAALLNPPLTAIVQPAFDIGMEAAKELFSVLNKKKTTSLENKTIILSSRLVERKSTAS
ncbi:LacI family DNA-binding transcriptional regulator [Pedobacter sp. P351]|uniref:LacI family DNA-binding transcriptional regulator n=1 Tax=Pedobacter superstes TaxID=3133441 RepID=UPI0030B62F40